MVNLQAMKRILPFLPILLSILGCSLGLMGPDGGAFAFFPLIAALPGLFAAGGGAGAAGAAGGAAMGGAGATQAAVAGAAANEVNNGWDPIGDFTNAGNVNYQATPYQNPGNWYGGYEEGAIDQANIGQQGMFGAQGNEQRFIDEAFGQRGPQGWENANLSGNEAWSRGYDQAGALQLAREAAMGNAPSEAAWQMQRGLDQAIAGQQSQVGGARGAAAIANAQGNASGNIAALQNQTYGQAAQLRAQEMANARAQYGGLASQVREQDLARLQTGNQMSQFNATLNDDYRTRMGQLGAQYGQQGVDWYRAYQEPYKTQGIMTGQNNATNQASWDSTQQTNAGISASNAENKVANRDKLIGMGATLLNSGGQMAMSGKGGGK